MQEEQKNSQDSEFMLEPVPENKRRSTASQVMVWIGFGYAVTGLIVGGTLGGYGGWRWTSAGRGSIGYCPGNGFTFSDYIFFGDSSTENRVKPFSSFTIFLWKERNDYSHACYGTAYAGMVCQYPGHDR